MTSLASPAEPTAPTSLDLTLREQVERTHRLRLAAAEAKERLDAAKRAFEVEHAALITESTTSVAAVAEAEHALRGLAVAVYQTTRDKAPAPGVKIEEPTVVQYEPTAALAWAREHGAALLLDAKGFEAIARAMPLPFVTLTKVPKATLAKDLGAALGAA